ncbi:anti-sigma factor [Staphylococcus equorum]|uniref:anti-sigma factor n=1 Tax=Staphylococcus equorum TaxID=246432 RepID=UPI000853BC57|nr:anti-sigma factor [Staphylococcus equorum]OEK76826.1 hypothetical protein AST05_07140 [Staphylococcus equorum]
MKDNKVDKLYDYFNGNLSESEKEQVEKELDLSSESHETLDDLNVLHDSLPYSNQEIEPPTGMKKRILTSVLDEDNNSNEEAEKEQQEDEIGTTSANNNHENQQIAHISKHKKKKSKSVITKRVSIGVIVALLFLSIIGNGVQYFGYKESQNQSSSMINTNDAKPINLNSMARDEVQGQAYLSKSNGTKDRKLMVEANDIEPTEGNEVYQVWILKGEQAHPAGTFASANDKGMVVFDLSNVDVDKEDKIAITLEPSPNNKQPKGQMIMSSNEI